MKQLRYFACVGGVCLALAGPGVAVANPVAAAPAAAAGTAAPVQVIAHLDRATAALGETFVLTADVSYPQDLAVNLPAPDSLRFDPFEVRDAVETPLPSSGGRRAVRYTVRLVSWQTGRETVPPLPIEVPGTGEVQSPALIISVPRAAGVPPPGSRATPVDIRDLKPMDAIPTPLWMTLAAAAGGALVLGLVGALGALLWRRVRPQPRPTTPQGVAWEALDRLEAENLPRQGRLKQHYDRLASILRTYLAERFALPVLEHTTSEVLAMMRSGPFADSLCAQVQTVLAEADLVKFARRQVSADCARAQVKAVRTIVLSTTPAVPVTPADPPAAVLVGQEA